MKQLWNKLKNEPVLLVAFIAIVAQAGQQALSEGHFTFTLWMTYIFQMVMASIARELVVPGTKHAELEDSVSKAIVSLETDYQARMNHPPMSKEEGGAS